MNSGAVLTIDGTGTLTSKKASYGVIYVSGGTFIMNGGTIRDNNGSGVFIGQNGSFTLTKGTITENIKPSGSDYGGAGVCLYDCTFLMSGGEITNNVTTDGGGGIYAANGAVQISGGKITGNTGSGGAGISASAASGDTVALELSDGEMQWLMPIRQKKWK